MKKLILLILAGLLAASPSNAQTPVQEVLSKLEIIAKTTTMDKPIERSFTYFPQTGRFFETGESGKRVGFTMLDLISELDAEALVHDRSPEIEVWYLHNHPPKHVESCKDIQKEFSRIKDMPEAKEYRKSLKDDQEIMCTSFGDLYNTMPSGMEDPKAKEKRGDLAGLFYLIQLWKKVPGVDLTVKQFVFGQDNYTITTIRFPHPPSRKELGRYIYLYELMRRDLPKDTLIDPDRTIDYFREQADKLYEQTDGVVKMEFVKASN